MMKYKKNKESEKYLQKDFTIIKVIVLKKVDFKEFLKINKLKAVHLEKFINLNIKLKIR